MNYSTLEFYILFPVMFTGYWLLKSNTVRKIYLLHWSYYFYALWDYRFAFLILFQTAFDYIIGNILVKKQINGKKNKIQKLLVLISIAVNLILLFFFKYFNFFSETLGSDFRFLHIVMPIGISFYTFRSISYIVDLYKKKTNPAISFIDYALFINFSPILLAGPIVRAQNLLPQFARTVSFNRNNIAVGFKIFVIGLFQKIFIADRLSFFVDSVFINASVFDTGTCWLAIFAYTIQIYCDFQGYSNMAIGTSKMLGYEIPINFNWPYLATNINEFWRRWHITLSDWILEYLYIPLGGNRKGEGRTTLNLLITMSLCGLWHGASWNFVLWGSLHGIVLVVQRTWRKHFKGMRKGTSWLITQCTVSILWVFFGTKSITHSIIILKQLFILRSGVPWLQPFVCFIIIAAILIHFFRYKYKQDLLPTMSWHTQAVLLSLIWLIIVFPPKKFTPFVYAQF
ncbi:MAG: MBOAT family protein [Candidatus Electrothrix sp. LOE2]|nr:MBOAT family protein [Candidatus Electrothrix sp. LOE2]